ncbi:MAG: 4Fe-4S dicluster domain-containing protein [Deltaproteobacteria bacterium]|nr:4Fe-4S dicluster domain-containing protein [Deltaproteobacteria bacterium]
MTMIKPRLHTSVEVKGGLQDVKTPATVRIPLDAKHKATVKKKQLVSRGQIVAENSTKNAYCVGYVHASIDGAVEEIGPGVIVIGPAPASKEGEAPPEFKSPEPCAELGSLTGEELVRTLMELGIDTHRFHPSRTLIVNGLNPEPGVSVSECLLKHAHKTLEKGVQVLERAIRPGSIKLVAAAGTNPTLHGCTTVEASDLYPATIDPLVVHAVTGAERPDNVDIISVSDLYRVGRVAETGQPLVEAVITVGDHFFRVPTGMAVSEILSEAGVTPAAGWKVALGGPMRGQAIGDLGMGIPENATAVTVVPAGEFPEVAPNPCVNCGECVLACPARIQPGMLSRNAEFGFFEATRTLHVEACLECGMCTFVCPANRPVMHYILMAKAHLAARDAEVATCRLQD